MLLGLFLIYVSSCQSGQGKDSWMVRLPGLGDSSVRQTRSPRTAQPARHRLTGSGRRAVGRVGGTTARPARASGWWDFPAAGPRRASDGGSGGARGGDPVVAERRVTGPGGNESHPSRRDTAQTAAPSDGTGTRVRHRRGTGRGRRGGLPSTVLTDRMVPAEHQQVPYTGGCPGRLPSGPGGRPEPG